MALDGLPLLASLLTNTSNQSLYLSHLAAWLFTPLRSALLLTTTQVVILLISKPMGHMSMKRDHVPKIVPLDTHPALAFHVSVTLFALYNTSMTVLPRGASLNFYFHISTQMVSLFSHCMMAFRHNFNLQPIVANFLIFNLNLILDDTDINMSILFPPSNSFPPPPSSLTSSSHFPGRSSKPVRVLWVLAITLTCLTYFSPSSPLWMLYLLLTFPPLRKLSPLYLYKAATDLWPAHRLVSLAN